MPNIAVTPEELQSVGAQLMSGAGEIDAIQSQLAGQVAPLQGTWQGVAQARFHELFTQWHTSSRQLQEALTGIAALTQQAAASFDETEQSIAASFGR